MFDFFNIEEKIEKGAKRYMQSLSEKHQMSIDELMLVLTCKQEQLALHVYTSKGKYIETVALKELVDHFKA